jgi:tetratricopeptide (TPR) repeat protein
VLERAELLAGDGTAVAAAAMSNRAECLLDADRFEEALDVFRRAAAGFEACGRAHASAIVRGNIADVLGRLGRIDEATQAFEDARRAFELTGAALDVARLDGEEAEMLVQAGALRMARDRYAHAVPILKRASAAAELSRARAAFGLVLVRLGDARSARQMLEQTASESLSLDIPGLEAEVGIALAVCDLLENKPDNATRRTDAILADPDLASSRRAPCPVDQGRVRPERRGPGHGGKARPRCR